MASPIPPPLFLPSPGDPSLPWADWKLVFQAYADAAGEDASKPERRKALLLNALGPAGLKLFYTLDASNASPTPASGDAFKNAVALFDEHFKDASCDYLARVKFQERRQLPGEPVADFPSNARRVVRLWRARGRHDPPSAFHRGSLAKRPLPHASKRLLDFIIRSHLDCARGRAYSLPVGAIRSAFSAATFCCGGPRRRLFVSRDASTWRPFFFVSAPRPTWTPARTVLP